MWLCLKRMRTSPRGGHLVPRYSTSVRDSRSVMTMPKVGKFKAPRCR